MTGQDLIILAGWYLAVAEMTYLITAARLTDDTRIWFMHRRWHGGPQSMMSDLVNCSWCMGVWVAAASTAVPVYMADRTWPQAVLLAFGAAYFTGMMSRFYADDAVIEVVED